MFKNNVFQTSLGSDDFRRILFTGEHSQLVVMSLNEGEDIGLETHHKNDQILFIVDGSAKVTVGDDQADVGPNVAVAVPAGTPHNVWNIGPGQLKLVTIYGPADHEPNTVHHLKSDALTDEGPPEQ